MPKLEFLGAFGNTLTSTQFLSQVPSLRRLYLDPKHFGATEQELLKRMLRITPGLLWFNGTFLPAKHKKEILGEADM